MTATYRYSEVFQARQHFIDGGRLGYSLFSILTYREISGTVGTWIALSEVVEGQIMRGEKLNLPRTLAPRYKALSRIYYNGLKKSLKELEYHGVFDCP